MTAPILPDLFSPDLLPGESIQWTGQPNPSIVFHRDDWVAIPFSLLWGGFAIFWFLTASGLLHLPSSKPNHGFQIFGLIWGTPFVLMGQYFIWGRFVHERWKKKRTYYALTNRRALIVTYNFRHRTSSSAWFENLPMIDKRVRSDGIGSISFGGPVTARDWSTGKNRPPRPPTFDDLDHADAVYQTIIRLYDRARNLAPTSPWPS